MLQRDAVFYDAVCGVPLFTAQVGRSMAASQVCFGSVLQCIVVCCNLLQCFTISSRRVFLYCLCRKKYGGVAGNVAAVCCSMLRCAVACYSVLQCIAVCHNVVQRVAVCCHVLQCVAVYDSMLQCVAVCCGVVQCGSVLQCALVSCCVVLCIAARCRVMHCVAVCCSVLQRVAVCCIALHCVAVQCGGPRVTALVERRYICTYVYVCICI